MGGRKSYTLEAVVGKSAGSKEARRRFLSSIEAKDHRKIVAGALDLTAKSDKLVLSLTEAVKALDFVRSNSQKPPLNAEQRKRLAAAYLAQRKKEPGASADLVVDKIFVDTLARVLRRRRRK
jgi:hypothetical protein